MELMKRRREIIASQQESYITNGLVLWLDGIDKGSTPNVWTDKMAGYEFAPTGNPVFGSSYVEFDGSSYLTNSTFIAPYGIAGTIEVCYDLSQQGNVFRPQVPNNSYAIAFGYYSGNVIWGAGNSQGKRNLIASPPNKAIVSVNDDAVLVNGAQGTLSSAIDYWIGYPSYSVVGAKPDGTSTIIGKIYSIRIYNRKLTASEMLHNQALDNKRFNFGLNI